MQQKRGAQTPLLLFGGFFQRDQNWTRNANSSCRGVAPAASLLMLFAGLPVAVVVLTNTSVLFGFPGLIWLNTLNESIRNLTTTLSQMGNDFVNVISVLKNEGPKYVFDPAFPITPRPGNEKIPPVRG